MGSEKWRGEVRRLSDKGLLDELQKPIYNWNEDVLRETLYRILKSQLTPRKKR